MANLCLYEADIQMKYKKIFKTLIKSSRKNDNAYQIVKLYLYNNCNIIGNILIDQLTRAKEESIIFVIGKILKCLVEDNDYLAKILNFDLFKKIYTLTKSDKFVYSTEAFKLLCVLNL